MTALVKKFQVSLSLYASANMDACHTEVIVLKEPSPGLQHRRVMGGVCYAQSVSLSRVQLGPYMSCFI